MDTKGKNQETVFTREARVIGKTFNRQPVVWEQGQGCRLTDLEGRTCLDFFSGHAVMNLGYGHPAQMKAMQEQLKALVHTGNLYYLVPQIRLAELLVEHTFGDKVMFANSGAEIVELAVKLARKWGRRERPQDDPSEIITLRNSFHGRTFGALSATGQEKYHRGIGPMLPGFKHVSMNNFATTASAITNKTCAILVEPVQGEGGIHPGTQKYLQDLRGLCDRNGLLLIFDEIQCGLGRSGRMNAYEHFGVTPDVLLLGKPLGGGLPISALVTTEAVASAMAIGDHGSTFGGNPVAAAGGIVLIEEMAKPGFLDAVREYGAFLGEQLGKIAEAFAPHVVEVRGVGMMWGMELKDKGPEVVRQALQAGLIINCTAGNVLRFLPALTVGKKEIEEAMAVLQKAMRETFSE